MGERSTSGSARGERGNPLSYSRYYTLKTSVNAIFAEAVFRDSRGWEASGRGESSGAFCPTRKAAPGGARQRPKGHEADPRLAGAGRAARAPPAGRRRRDRPAEPLPPRRPAPARCGSDAGDWSETPDRPPRSTAVTDSVMSIPARCPPARERGPTGAAGGGRSALRCPLLRGRIGLG